MTEYLFAARAAIILWTALAVMPAEVLFDAIEAELERRGIDLKAAPIWCRRVHELSRTALPS